MNIDENLHCIWYENEAGDKWFPDMTNNSGPPDEDRPDEYVYMHSILTNTVHEGLLMIIRQQDVDACAHDGEMKTDDGIVDHMKGRTCRQCHGYQSITKGGDWRRAKWEAMGSVDLGVGSSGWDEKLVMAMTRPTEAELYLSSERELDRCAKVVAERQRNGEKVQLDDLVTSAAACPKTYRLFDAILVSARSCERCWNALLWRYGCGGEKGGDPGYVEGGEQWHKCGTSCVFCEHMPSTRDGAGKPPSELKYVGPSEGAPP